MFFILLTLSITTLVVGLILFSTNMTAGIITTIVGVIFLMLVVLYYLRRQKRKEKSSLDGWDCVNCSPLIGDCDCHLPGKNHLDCSPNCDCDCAPN